MAFDEQLTRAFETLTARLRGEIDQEVVRRIAALPHAHAPVAAAPWSAPAAADTAATETASRERLADALRAIDAARTLTGVLDALLAAARAESADAAIWLRRGGHLYQWRRPGSDDTGHDAPCGSLVLPIALAGADVALLDAEPGTDNSQLRTQNLEFLTRYAAKSLEALTAFKTARALTQRDEAAAPSGPDEANGEDDLSALRYARLLVSEIKLYHEPAVGEGRRDRDLATRLGGEIARARAMYEQRVPPDVRERADYFHDELVRTLCNGDGSLLEVRT